MIRNTEELRDCLEDCFPMMDFQNLNPENNYDDDREDAISRGVEKLHDYMHEPIPGQPTGSSLEAERESNQVRGLNSALVEAEADIDLLRNAIMEITGADWVTVRNTDVVWGRR